MNKERLLNTTVALRESRAPKSFSMEKYMHICGTPACVIGNYAARNDLQDFLRLATADERTQSGSSMRYVSSGNPADYDSPAVLQHFGLTPAQAEELFGANGCGYAETAEEAIAYIERFVEEQTLLGRARS